MQKYNIYQTSTINLHFVLGTGSGSCQIEVPAKDNDYLWQMPAILATACCTQDSQLLMPINRKTRTPPYDKVKFQFSQRREYLRPG
jgi:hypothetical protein